MEISDVLNSIIYNTFVKYWYFWLIIILIPIIFMTLGWLVKHSKKKISRNKPTYKYISTDGKGLFGEKIVSTILKGLNPENYKIINNLNIKNGKETAQIDHLVVSNFGIFVIETKNLSGIIYGGESTNYWTQKFSNAHKEKFLNPIRQNDWHISVLKNILKKFKDILFIPIIVFLEDADLMVSTTTDVIYIYDLLKTISRYRSEIIADDIKDEIYNFLIT